MSTNFCFPGEILVFVLSTRVRRRALIGRLITAVGVPCDGFPRISAGRLQDHLYLLCELLVSLRFDCHAFRPVGRLAVGPYELVVCVTSFALLWFSFVTSPRSRQPCLSSTIVSRLRYGIVVALLCFKWPRFRRRNDLTSPTPPCGNRWLICETGVQFAAIILCICYALSGTAMPDVRMVLYPCNKPQYV